MGFFTLNLLPGAVLSDGDYIRIEGIRGRIDASAAVVPDADLFVDLQSINDPRQRAYPRIASGWRSPSRQ